MNENCEGKEPTVCSKISVWHNCWETLSITGYNKERFDLMIWLSMVAVTFAFKQVSLLLTFGIYWSLKVPKCVINMHMTEEAIQPYEKKELTSGKRKKSKNKTKNRNTAQVVCPFYRPLKIHHNITSTKNWI